MRIPQELINAIIGEFDLSEKFDSLSKTTLESCALVSRSCVRLCQARLFARISVYDYEQNPTVLSQQLSAALASSPHLAGYIRTLNLYYTQDSDETEFVSRILCAVTALHTLILEASYFKDSFPIDAATLAVFALPSLRRIQLFQYQFANAYELQSLLSRSAFLEDLKLSQVDFRGDEEDGLDADPAASPVLENNSSKVVLRSLALDVMEPVDVDMMLESFTTVDITHLHSLSLSVSPITGLLHANAGSLQTIKIGHVPLTFENSDYQDEIDIDILACENQLSVLNFETEDLESVLFALPLFGDLANLKVLKTVRIVMSESLDADVSHEDPQWAQLDARLAQIRSVGVVEVRIYACFDSKTNRMDAEDVERVMKCLPLVLHNGMLSLHLCSNLEFSSDM
ncbi:hypothetical protein FB451DRAFT_1289561 [Mycena latifolia]|nr:hypothetical protein FB451DRAFT_1289561 [Mycena latifolia]